MEIVERKKDGIIKVRLKEHFGFEPKGPLDIEISIVGRCKVDEGVTDDEVLETVRSAGYPLYAARSQVISYISGLTVGVPIIIPPYAYKPSGDRSGEKAVEAEIEVSE